MIDTITVLMQAVDTIADVYLRMLDTISEAYAKDGFKASAGMAQFCKHRIRSELRSMHILDEVPRDLPTAVLERIIAEYHRALDAMADQFIADMDARDK